jgi:hypothetical protein
VLWDLPNVCQREKMLNGFVFGPASSVRTPWYLKLDTDSAAVAHGDWLQMQWFVPSDDGKPPVFVTSPWSYTKPADAIERLDAWAESVPGLSEFPALNLHPQPGSQLLAHKRIISWCFFGLTQWTTVMASYCAGRLPTGSQDTFLWYCAARRGEFFRTVRMSKFGWKHIASTRRLRAACNAALTSVHPDTEGKST